MSNEGKEPSSTWQGPSDAQQDQHMDEEQLEDQDEQPFHSGPKPRLLAFFEQYSHYIWFVVLPLLFGGLTCLFVLPAIASGNASAAPLAFWPITFILVIIAIAQGIGAYYVGTDKSLLVLVTLGGFFLFLLVGCFVLFGSLAGVFLLVFLLGLSILLGRLYVHPVPEGYVTIVYAFGKYTRTLYPGFNILFPWEKARQQLNVGETQWVCPLQRVQLSHDEDVVLRATISYQLLPEDAYLAVTQVNRWEESLRELFVATLQTMATTFSPEDFIARPHRSSTHQPVLPASDDYAAANPRWERVNSFLFTRIGDRVALWGVQLNWVRIRDVEIIPHTMPVLDTEPADEEPTPSAPVAKAASAQQPKSTVSTPQPKGGDDTPTVVDETLSRALHSDSSSTPAKLPKEEILIKAYKEVQSGTISDPDTIRAIAAKFQLVANNPEASKSVSFDAARAALNLYSQASKLEEQYNAEPIYDDETRPDWSMRKAGDGNFMPGN